MNGSPRHHEPASYDSTVNDHILSWNLDPQQQDAQPQPSQPSKPDQNDNEKDTGAEDKGAKDKGAEDANKDLQQDKDLDPHYSALIPVLQY